MRDLMCDAVNYCTRSCGIGKFKCTR